MRAGRLPITVTIVGGALLVGGCDTPVVKRLNDPNAYMARANESFADIDVLNRLEHVLAQRHGDIDGPLRAAMRANRRVTPLKPPGTSVAAYPPREPKGSIVYVAVVVDSTGKPSDVICEAAPSSNLTVAQMAYIDAAIRGWQFTPATIDALPVAAQDSFRVETDGTTFVRPLPDHH